MAEHEHTHEHDQDEELSVITMVDEDGNEEDFVILDVVDIHGKQYALLTKPENIEEDEPEVLLMRLENDTLVNIEDENEFNHVISHLEGHAHH